MNLKTVPQAAKQLGISSETARKLAKTRWTTYRVGPGSVLVDVDEILAEAKEKPEPRPTQKIEP
jgi:hypothetical protein